MSKFGKGIGITCGGTGQLHTLINVLRLCSSAKVFKINSVLILNFAVTDDFAVACAMSIKNKNSFLSIT